MEKPDFTLDKIPPITSEEMVTWDKLVYLRNEPLTGDVQRAFRSHQAQQRKQRNRIIDAAIKAVFGK